MNTHKKSFKLSPQQIRPLIPNMGGCYASDRITVDGSPVGYMYREEPDNEIDSGWRFFAGDESEEYSDTPDNFAIYEVNTICNYDPAVVPYLNAPYGSAYGRVDGSEIFEAEELDPIDD
jgi:hypothetical protein